jgi:hypothetical protein
MLRPTETTHTVLVQKRVFEHLNQVLPFVQGFKQLLDFGSRLHIAILFHSTEPTEALLDSSITDSLSIDGNATFRITTNLFILTKTEFNWWCGCVNLIFYYSLF